MITFVPNIFAPNIFESQPLESALEDIRAGRFRATVEHYRANQNPELKKQLPAWAFNGTFKTAVTSSNLDTHSNVFHFDIDKLDGDIEAHKQIIACIPGMLFCFVSTSGTGLKGGVALMQGCVKGDDDLKAIYPYFKAMFAEWGYTLDDTCKDVRRLCFVSYDPNIYINSDADPVTPDRVTVVEPKPAAPRNLKFKNIDPAESAHCIKKVCAILLEAEPGTKHHARNRAGQLAGGYIAAGVVHADELMKELHRVSHSIDPTGRAPRSEVKTLNEAVESGTREPVYNTGYSAPVDITAIEWGDGVDIVATTDSQTVPREIPKPPDKDTLLDLLPDDNVLKTYAREVAKTTKLPESTVFLVGCSVFSSLAMRRFKVQYSTGGCVPLGLYVVAEQPSGAAKSRAMAMFQHDAIELAEQKAHEIKAEIDALDAAGDSASPELARLRERYGYVNAPLFVQNSTPEGLDMLLEKTHGFFGAAASEKGLLNSLLGGMYKERGAANNNDSVLNGFDAGRSVTLRTSRKPYAGLIVGSLTAFAQAGTIKSVLDADAAAGVAERFLMIAEPHNIGHRDHHVDYYPPNHIMNGYNAALQFLNDVFDDPKQFKNLTALTLSCNAHFEINEYRNRIEPLLKDSGVYSHNTLRGTCSKVNMQIMKIAGCLHVAMMPRNVVLQIPDELVLCAIDVVDYLLQRMVEIADKEGITGRSAEEECILKAFEKNTTRTLRQLVMTRIHVLPFSTMSGNKSAAVKAVVQTMMLNGDLMVREEKGVQVFYVAK